MLPLPRSDSRKWACVAAETLKSLLVLVTLIAPTSVWPVSKEGEGRIRLEKYLKDFSTLKAGFDQVLLNEKGKTLETAKGVVYLQRPGKFRWDYQQPSEQSIVADGTKVWIYDKELAQVTVKQLNAAIGNTPALLLGGKVNIDREFSIKELGNEAGMAWIALEPHDKRNQYADIRLGFAGAELKRMELHDNLGQTTRITFSDEQRNPAIDAQLFNFVPPKGVDVINAKDL